jgi:ribosomal-protein-alanine N-acetyltransferase
MHLSDITLKQAPLSDYPLIQNMGRFYVYDMSEYMGDEEGWKIPADGLYECIDFKKYWDDKNAFPFLVHFKEEIAGFVIIDKKGSGPDIDYNMAQFFILRKFKNRGLGCRVAEMCFEQFKGSWEVMVMPKNSGAYQFWQKVIRKYRHNQFEEYTKVIPHLNHCKKTSFTFLIKKLLIKFAGLFRCINKII